MSFARVVTDGWVGNPRTVTRVVTDTWVEPEAAVTIREGGGGSISGSRGQYWLETPKGDVFVGDTQPDLSKLPPPPPVITPSEPEKPLGKVPAAVAVIAGAAAVAAVLNKKRKEPEIENPVPQPLPPPPPKQRKAKVQDFFTTVQRNEARDYVKELLKTGELTRPDVCDACENVSARLVIWHDDPRKPDEVNWLCWKCYWQAKTGVRVKKKHYTVVTPEAAPSHHPCCARSVHGNPCPFNGKFTLPDGRRCCGHHLQKMRRDYWRRRT